MIDPNHHPLVEAARYADAQGGEHGLEGFVGKVGVDMDALMFVAKQRSLRIALLRSRGPIKMQEITNQKESFEVQLSEDEERMMLSYMPAYMDGMIIGWEARRLADNN